jgi:predicted transcriptional regulator
MNTLERVGHAMTGSVLSIDVNEPASEVLRLFAGYPIHHLPVLSGQKVVGMLSSADVMKLDALLPKGGVPADQFLNQRIRLATLMSKPVVTIRPERLLTDAAELMARHGIHALPVVNAQDDLLGIITTTDIIHAALQSARQSNVASDSGENVHSRDIRLTGAALEHAIAAAKTAIDAGQDQEGIAMALLFAHRRFVALEHVLQIADRYLNCGQDQSQRVALLKAIEDAKSTMPSGSDSAAPLGLASD